MQAYVVGGAVRDALLGLPVKDRDWVVVGATPEAMMAQGAPIRVMRDFGLGMVDRIPGLKSYFIREAAGASGRDRPRLLGGQSI